MPTSTPKTHSERHVASNIARGCVGNLIERYVDEVTQAEKGCDFRFVQSPDTTANVPRSRA
jgi:hypothetical protein